MNNYTYSCAIIKQQFIAPAINPWRCNLARIRIEPRDRVMAYVTLQALCRAGGGARTIDAIKTAFSGLLSVVRLGDVLYVSAMMDAVLGVSRVRCRTRAVQQQYHLPAEYRISDGRGQRALDLRRRPTKSHLVRGLLLV